MVDQNGWIGVDLDGTLVTYDKWVAWNVFGDPIAPMVERVRKWIADGREVKIITARIGLPRGSNSSLFYSKVRNRRCSTGDKFSDYDMFVAIWDLTERVVGTPLRAQCFKDFGMIEQWDDRAVQIIPNTGMRADGR